MKQFKASLLFRMGRSWDLTSQAGRQLVGGDAAVSSGEGMQSSPRKSGSSAAMATCCAKLQRGALRCIIILELLAKGQGSYPQIAWKVPK